MRLERFKGDKNLYVSQRILEVWNQMCTLIGMKNIVRGMKNFILGIMVKKRYLWYEKEALVWKNDYGMKFKYWYEKFKDINI